MKMPPTAKMLPTTPPINILVDLLWLDDGLVMAEWEASLGAIVVDEAAIEVEDDAVEVVTAGAAGAVIAEYSGLSVWLEEKIAAVKSLGGQPPSQGSDKQQPKNGGGECAQDHHLPLVHAAGVILL